VDCDLIVFDMGGTITDFQSTWTPIIRRRIELLVLRYGERFREQFLNTIGLEPSSWKADLSGPFMLLAEEKLIFVLAMVLYENGIAWPRAVESVKDCYQQTNREINRLELVRLIPGIDSTLRKFKGLGLSLAIATMEKRSDTHLELGKFGILDLFDAIVTVDDVGKHKPDPEMIFEVCNTLKIVPERAIMVGDTPADLIMGKRAGVVATVALTGNPTTEIQSLADAVITTYSEISAVDPKNNLKT